MSAIASFVVCPETLGPLEPREDGLWSPRAQRLYPVREGLVFLGYPTRDAEMIGATMAEEHAWQGTAETVDRDLEFLRESAPNAVRIINLATAVVQVAGQPRALELGAGSAWVSWLLARAGYDTWACDFEANSLAIGLMHRHANLGEGRRFVADARYVPFADASFDLVMCKEFVHHVADFERLFQEANRVLRPGGVLALAEPTRSVKKTLIELRHPDPHEGHVITWVDRYRRALRRSGFEILRETAAYAEREHRVAAVGRLKELAARSVRDLGEAKLATKLHLRLLGDATSVLVCRKQEERHPAERPPMTVIAPETLVITPEERAAFAPFRPVLEAAAERLVPVAAGTGAGAASAPQPAG